MTDVLPDPITSVGNRPIADARFENLKETGFTTRAVTPADSELWLKMGQLRGHVYTEKGFISESVLDENGAEYDEHDEYSDHFVAVDDNGEVIGTVRVIKRVHEGLLLPSEEEFDVVLPEATQEISRFMRHPNVPPRMGPLVSVALMRAALKATFGVSDRIYAVLEDSLHTELGDKHIGIGLRTVADPKYIERFHTINHLVEMEPRAITSQIFERDQEPRTPLLGQHLAEFFEKYSATNGLGRVALEDLTTPNTDQYERNEGFSNVEQRKELWSSTVAIAGAGGDGGEVALRVLQAGVGHIRLADPEFFEVANINRQFGASYETIGDNKSEAVAAELRLRFPSAVIEVYGNGIDHTNVAEFVADADLVIDEVEYTEHAIGAMLAQESRRQNKTVLTVLNVGHGAYTTSFVPDGMTYEKYFGLKENGSYDEIAAQKVPLNKWVVHVPSYANTDLFMKVATGERKAPTMGTGVGIAGGIGGAQALALLLKDTSPEYKSWIHQAPRGQSVDAKDGTHTVRFRAAHFYASYARAAIRTRLGKNRSTTL